MINPKIELKKLKEKIMPITNQIKEVKSLLSVF
jgi:hypothetical protein